MMMLSRLAISTAAIALVIAATAARADDARTVFDEKVPSGVVFKLINVAGDVKVARSSSDHLQVVAKVIPSGENATHVVPTVQKGDGWITICSRDADAQPEPVCSGEMKREWSKGRSDSTRVDYTIAVPDGLATKLVNVNGQIVAKGLHAELDAVNVNGDVELETTGPAKAVTVNGSVRAIAGKVDGNTKFATVNGNIDVTLPATCDAEISASTTSGSIISDLPLKRHEMGPLASAKATLGSGAAKLSAATVNGNIKLQQQK
jgi:Putative adhesin